MIDGDRPGYKKTKIGWFPADWEVRRIDEVAPLQRGFDLPSKLLNNGKYPVVYSNGVLNYHSDFKVKGPGVVTGRSGTIGKVTFVESDYWPHNTSLWVTDFKGNFPKYIFYFFQHLRLERFNAGTGVPTLNRNDVHSFKIPLPPLAEQKKIAEILSTWDRAIELTDKLIAAKEQRKKALMQRLLTGKVRFREFAGEAWKEMALRDFLLPTVREVDKPKIQFRALGVRSHCKGTFLKPDFDPGKIDMEKLYEVKANDLIVNITFAWEGAIALVKPEDDGALVSHRFPTYVFDTTEVTPNFFQFVVMQKKFRHILRLISPGGAGRNRVLSKRDFLKIKWELPLLPEQQKIAAVLQAADHEIELLRQKREALVQQKKGLMQALLTGKVRVNIAETRRDPEGVG